MGRKKKEQPVSKEVVSLIENADTIVEAHNKDLQINPELSLDVDPTNQYNLSDEHKQFIKLYCDTGSLQFTQALMNIPTENINAYFKSYASQQEIRRINRAKLQRRFQVKMLNINEIGGYLTSLITDEDVPLADRLNSKDKLQVANMIIELNKLKAEVIKDQNIIDYKDVEETAKNMSIDAIRSMLAHKNTAETNTEKDTLISKLNVDNVLSPEEIDYLKSLSITELMKMLNSITK